MAHRVRLLGLAVSALLALIAVPAPSQAATGARAAFTVLVFSKTAGYRHASIPDGIAALQSLGRSHGFTVDATEDAAWFTDETLAAYDVVVFLNTTGDVLNDDQQAAFERFIRGGGGFVGIHSAADTEHGWPWYGQLVGAYFQSHPQIQEATIEVADRVHPSTDALPARWTRTDEWYNYTVNPRGQVHVLATLDEASYSGGEDGYDHPIAWCHDFDGGRSWYTGAGHTEAGYDEPLFQDQLLGGLRYAAGEAPGTCSATIEANYDVVVLDDNTLNPVMLDVAPDGRVFFIERTGTVHVYDPSTSRTTPAGELDVFTEFEDGLIGIALDPNFATTLWIYLFYSPAGAEAKQRVSRFTMVGNTMDMNSEQVLLEIPTQRDQCCHSSGALAFGPDGHLFIGVGDNTSPFGSDGYAPIDERKGPRICEDDDDVANCDRSPWDAQKSSANTQDLRGKILRILPQPDGTYTIPEGNLFDDPAEGRPEIYVMGNRNPYRLSVDSETGWLYWGEVGPDADAASERGPAGYDEWNQARTAGNYGWPYCIADNKAYNDYDFATGTVGAPFNCNAPVNDSPNSTGATELPPAQPALIWYPYGPSPDFPELGSGSRTAMAGPVYHFDPALDSDRGLPDYFDNTLFIYEWSRGWIKEVKLDDSGNILKINPFLPNLTLRHPIDMKIGPDGALYMIEWGSAFWGANTDSRLVRIDYHSGQQPSPNTPPDADPPRRLVRVYPNPFSERGYVQFDLPEPAPVHLEVYDLLGRRVLHVAEGFYEAGTHTVTLHGAMLASGIYLCRLQTPFGLFTQRMVVIR